MLELVEAERSLHICLQRATMTLDAYTTESKARVQVCEALGLRVGATEVAVKVLAEENRIDMSKSSNANKWKYYIDKSKVQFQKAVHLNGMKIFIYKGLKAEVKTNWSVQGVNKVPKTISDAINKSDNFIDSKTGVKARDGQGLDFMQQGEESSNKLGKVHGGRGHGQGGHGPSTTKQDGGGKSGSSNKNPSTTKGCYHCGKTGHIRHFSLTSPRSRDQSSIYKWRNRQRIRKRLKESHNQLRKVSYNFKLIEKNSLRPLQMKI